MVSQVEDIKSLKLLITIVNRGMGQHVVNVLKDEGIKYHVACLGRGTASSEILDLLNLVDTEKEIVLSVVTNDETKKAFDIIQETINIKKHGNGIAFSVPMKSIGGAATLKILAGLLQERS